MEQELYTELASLLTRMEVLDFIVTALIMLLFAAVMFLLMGRKNRVK